MVKKKALVFILVALVLLIAVWFIWFNTKEEPREYAQIEKDGVLNIVTDYNSVGYYVSGDTLAGFNYELIELLKTCTPLKIEVFLESSLDNSIEALSKGKYDVLARNIPITSELRSTLSFTDPITQNRQVLIQRRKEFNDGIKPIKSHLDLAKKTLYVPLNSPAILRIRNLSHEIGDTIFIKEDESYSAEQLAILVASKEIDYAVCDEKIASSIAKSLPEIDYSTLIGFTHIEAWAISEKSPVLLDSLNMWIRRMKNMPEYDKIYQKYYK
ncbi:transporter substrate-binding domain-containing protein [Dysgonomonas sp. Marseille-P4677]|uniref:transporter substrate-binding domain-containing protein n=1 Tax=Dysgonomonas sp. Marseille-P4677 TaxID=2364790 RepID=UPI00191133EA|nr:transporter substrate-binding domain-containing protein [Dysgonomonas sp. Marseille-P4677]MBK5721606.1 transporter substrate-binding domain-containing protein [Dysgonomonas sp. Marseille-P4677]